MKSHLLKKLERKQNQLEDLENFKEKTQGNFKIYLAPLQYHHTFFLHHQIA